MSDLPPTRGLRVVDVERCHVRVPFTERTRPWNEILVGQWGVVEVIRLTTNASGIVGYGETPPHYRLDIDWNEMLRDVGTAAPVLREPDREERVGIYQTPIRFGDLEGFRRLRDKTSRPIADHIKQGAISAAVRAEAFDGYVIEGGGANTISGGLNADAGNKPYLLQIAGPGLTTARTLQLAAVLPGAIWPSVTCLNIYSDDLIVDPIQVSGGYATVPEGPGLGVEVDESALTRLAMDAPYKVDYPASILTVSWPGGRARHYATVPDIWQDCRIGNVPAQDRGARLSVRLEDGTAEFAALRQKAAGHPVRA